MWSAITVSRPASLMTVKGRSLEQWQYEVTAGGRIWFGVDREAKIVWITYASTRHPKATD